MKRAISLGLIVLLACGCPPTEPAAKSEAPKPKPPDETRRFPLEGRVSMELVEDRLLDKDYLPGGNLAVYEKDGKRYQLFLIVLRDADAASLRLFDLKDKLADAKFVASFGGYYGLDGDTPWFVFSKTNHLAGVVGLSEADADTVARGFAARIP
jgi:hypothetical protein